MFALQPRQIMTSRSLACLKVKSLSKPHRGQGAETGALSISISAARMQTRMSETKTLGSEFAPCVFRCLTLEAIHYGIVATTGGQRKAGRADSDSLEATLAGGRRVGGRRPQRKRYFFF